MNHLFPIKNKETILKRFMHYIIQLFTQGTKPNTIALSIAIGITVGSFPLFGCATIVCAIIAIVFRLNMGIVQAANYIAAPIHFILIPIFFWFGSYLPWNKPLSFNIRAIKEIIPHTVSGYMELATSYVSGALILWGLFVLVATPLLYLLFFIITKVVYIKWHNYGKHGNM